MTDPNSPDPDSRLWIVEAIHDAIDKGDPGASYYLRTGVGLTPTDALADAVKRLATTYQHDPTIRSWRVKYRDGSREDGTAKLVESDRIPGAPTPESVEKASDELRAGGGTVVYPGD